MTRLDGKVAIVTGAGRGVGKGIAIRLAKEGARVVVASRTKDTIDQVVSSIGHQGGTAIGVSLDVGKRDEVNRMVAASVAAFGRVDILVNNAQSFGVPGSRDLYPKLTSLENLSEQAWDNTYQTGLKGTLYGMWAVFPGMRDRQWGRIINLGSRQAQFGMPGLAAYNSTKEAIRGLTRTAAREWAKHGITVNCINPVIATDAMLAHFDDLGAKSPEERQAMLEASVKKQMLPMGYGDAERDGGGLAAFLASDDSRFLTGMTFMLDGGLSPVP
jgi:NAD(P)-dependent dehydrogenase (short-subunit alcohol dehydrogenase family)